MLLHKNECAYISLLSSFFEAMMTRDTKYAKSTTKITFLKTNVQVLNFSLIFMAMQNYLANVYYY